MRRCVFSSLWQLCLGWTFLEALSHLVSQRLHTFSIFSCHFFLWKENNRGDVISLIEATQSSPAVEETKDQKSQLLDVEAKELVEWSVGVCVLVSRRWRS